MSRIKETCRDKSFFFLLPFSLLTQPEIWPIFDVISRRNETTITREMAQLSPFSCLGGLFAHQNFNLFHPRLKSYMKNQQSLKLVLLFVCSVQDKNGSKMESSTIEQTWQLVSVLVRLLVFSFPKLSKVPPFLEAGELFIQAELSWQKSLCCKTAKKGTFSFWKIYFVCFYFPRATLFSGVYK